MAITKLSNMTLVAQPSDGVCWWASAQMVYKWSKATGRGQMKSPDSDAGYAQRKKDNGDVYAFQNNILGRALNMKFHSSLSMDQSSVNSFLQDHGPIWTSVKKNWGGNNHGHVVVICGVADTGVLIYDPEPVNQGSSFWLTWDQIKKALAGVTDADPQFMTAV